MAGAGYKLFNTGDVLTAAQVNTYLQEQVVMVFANATARTTALSGVLAEGMMSYLQDTNAVEVYNGSAWVSVGNTGDITEVTTAANSGLTGGATSGAVALRVNTTAKGSIIAGTGATTLGELTVGANNTVLTADSATATGLKWAAPATSTFRGCLAAGNTLLVANNTITIVPFASTEVYDTDGYHSTTTNTGRITIPTGLGGYYLLWYSGTWEDSQAGDRIIYLYKNGSQINQVYQYVRDVPGGYFSQQFSTVVSTVAGDYFEVRVNQGSGGNKNLYGDSGAGNLPGLRFGCALLGV